MSQEPSGTHQRNFNSKHNQSLHDAALKELQYITISLSNKNCFFLLHNYTALTPEIYENII